MMSTNVQNLMVERAYSLKKIRVDRKDVEATVLDLFKYINFFNSLPEDTNILWGKRLDEIHIINEFSYFLQPASVRMDASDRAWSDLLDRSAISEEDVKTFKTLSYAQFLDLQIKFRGYFKGAISSDFKSISECRRNLNLSEALPYASIDGKVWYSGKPFMPIKLRSEIKFIDGRNMKYNVSEDDVIMDFMAELIF